MCVRVRVLVSVCMHDTTRTRLSRQHVVGGNAAPPCPCENRLTPRGSPISMGGFYPARGFGSSAEGWEGRAGGLGRAPLPMYILCCAVFNMNEAPI